MTPMLTELRKWAFGPQSDFKPGDSVELKEGGRMMQVIEVISYRNLEEPIICCKWYEPKTKETRTNIFRESKLKLFDWYNAQSEKNADQA
jgi:uncharacterized protein YodC (DUF2158 family)